MMKVFLATNWKTVLKVSLVLFLLYLLFGTSLPFLHHKTANLPSDITQETYLADAENGARVLYIADNTEALFWRLCVIEAAEEELLFSTFDFNDDQGGRDVMAALLRAADRGVSIRIVVDGVSGLLDMTWSDYFRCLAAHENITIKSYNPINVVKPWKWQLRLHDKYIVADQAMYMLGGRNTTDLFLGDNTEKQNIDGDLFVYYSPDCTDTSLSQLRDYFEEVWQLDDCKRYQPSGGGAQVAKATERLQQQYLALQEEFPRAFAAVDWTAETIPVSKITLLANPVEAENKEPILWEALCQLMQDRDDVLIQSPYVICNEPMYRRLDEISAQGAALTLLINDPNSGANIVGTADYRLEKKRIAKTGARVFEFSGDYSSHTKTVLIDERISVVGSFNMDMRSAYLDTELMLVVDSTALNGQLRELADETMAQCKERLPDGSYVYGEDYQEPRTSALQRGLSMTLGILTRPFRHLL